MRDGAPGDVRGWRILCGGAALLLLAAMPALIGYTSKRPSVLGRYSTAYAVLLLGAISLVIICAVLAALPASAAGKIRAVLETAAGTLLGRGWALAIAIAVLWLVILAPVLVFMHTPLGKSAALHAVALLFALWASLALIIAARPGLRERARAIARCACVLLLVAGGLGIAEAILLLRPGILPPHLLYGLPGGGEWLLPHYQFDEQIGVGYRFRPGIRMESRMLESGANLFIQQPGLVRPLETGRDEVLIEAAFITDENGYRNESPLRETYAIAVSGDSFTSLAVEPRPWPHILAAEMAVPVLNLGMQGYGPQSEVEALIRFGLPRRPQWVLLAYFEGNDLIDAQNYERKRRSGLRWDAYDLAQVGILERRPTFQLIRHGMRRILRGPIDSPEGPAGGHPYPFTAELGGRKVELSLSVAYISRLALSRQAVESLEAFSLAAAAMRRLNDAAREAGARLRVVYVPAKEHCYLPALPLATVEAAMGGARRLVIEDGGRIGDVDPQANLIGAAELLANLDGQRQALSARLEADGLTLLDLTPAFQEAARAGEQLYLVNDTHWSRAGHELAARVIARHLGR